MNLASDLSLVLGSVDSEARRIVTDLGVGATAQNAAEVESILASWYALWSAGAVEPSWAAEAIKAHALEAHASEYDRLLREIVGGRQAAG